MPASKYPADPLAGMHSDLLVPAQDRKLRLCGRQGEVADVEACPARLATEHNAGVSKEFSSTLMIPGEVLRKAILYFVFWRTRPWTKIGQASAAQTR
jgi:hypothetical protein